MAAPIGFVILSHRDPGQVARLVDRLRHLYGNAVPIVVHHDDRQSVLAPELVPGVDRVDPPIATRWGDWSLVEASLAGIQLLHARHAPDYAILLSGTDYPVLRADRAIARLREGGADAFVQARPVRYRGRDRHGPGPLGYQPNEGPGNQRRAWHRYVSTSVRWRGLELRLRSPLLAPLVSPYSRRFRPWAGSQWWVLGRAAVGALLDFPARRPDVVRWYARREVPDEGYVQTVIANAPGLRVEWTNFRYVDWSTQESHPRDLGLADLPAILRSGAHFARKFRPDDPALDAIDQTLGLPAWRGPGRRLRALD